MSLARLDLAVARIGQDNLEGAAEQVRAVLEVTGRRRTDSVVRRLRQISQVLQRPHLHGASLALDLREQVVSFCDSSQQAELFEGAR